MILSAGVLVYKVEDGALRVLIAHMGGPFWARKDEHAWSIPKGECDDGEDPRTAAAREYREEIGSPVPAGQLVDLGVFKQSSSKKIAAYAVEGDVDVGGIESNTFDMEWPPRSGRTQSFPEIDRAEWADCATARTKLVKGQVPVLNRLVTLLRDTGVVFDE
ncbi:NUDIX domain-containing protein [Antrihabitans cavernicola]|uniref:NUDIX domain-containing protein n=1 Tax=Antrihabitans cavernicola TaxID=2495913 RepID=A0A5A7SJ72_9NOCA|nr:NUDIX domain-containing protein [Spelaeibacter cavernicola]KAA0024485.1 NUDIX domain-containing protein [Spelaeibacter cavernicola]